MRPTAFWACVVAASVPFSKYDPHRPDDGDDGLRASTPAARRRALLLKYGWWVTAVYTAVGFAFLFVFWRWGNPF